MDLHCMVCGFVTEPIKDLLLLKGASKPIRHGWCKNCHSTTFEYETPEGKIVRRDMVK